MEIELVGNWQKGLAYDLHTLGSDFIGTDGYGNDQFDTTYSEMGKLVNQLKYHNNKSVINKIVDLLSKYKSIKNFDAIIPVPSTKKNRPYQPVDEIALELGERMGVAVLIGFLEKKDGGKELKNITDPVERTQELRNFIFISSEKNLAGQKVLLLDDLYQSGATLTVSTEILYEQAKVSKVIVLTMTKTRIKR